jgi:hypothetical protein
MTIIPDPLRAAIIAAGQGDPLRIEKYFSEKSSAVALWAINDSYFN